MVPSSTLMFTVEYIFTDTVKILVSVNILNFSVWPATERHVTWARLNSRAAHCSKDDRIELSIWFAKRRGLETS